MAKKAYVVFKGKRRGVYTSWPACSDQVSGYSCAAYVGYDSVAEAEKAWNDYLSSTNGLIQRRSSDIAVQPSTAKFISIFKVIVIFIIFWIVYKFF